MGGFIAARYNMKVIKTRHNIYYTLSHSVFIHTSEYGADFYFSSRLHLEKFLEGMEDSRTTLNYSLSKRFGIKCDVSNLADFLWYAKCETRGFYVKYKGDVLICKSDLRLDGVTLTKKH